MVSINSNTAALTALRNLNSVNDQLATTSKRIQTGYKVNDAVDDGATFAIAQGLRGQLKAFGAVKQSMSGATGLTEVTLAATKGIGNLIGDMRSKITELSADSLTAAQRTTLTNDLTKLRDQVDRFISNASFNGQNQIKNGGTARNFLANSDGSTISVSAVDLQTAKGTFDTALDVSTAAAATTSLAALDTFEQTVNNASNTFGGESRSIKAQSEFITAISDATTAGLSALVDADMEKEAANLISLQTRQQLAVQALSIANNAPQILLSLFR